MASNCTDLRQTKDRIDATAKQKSDKLEISAPVFQIL